MKRPYVVLSLLAIPALACGLTTVGSAPPPAVPVAPTAQVIFMTVVSPPEIPTAQPAVPPTNTAEPSVTPSPTKDTRIKFVSAFIKPTKSPGCNYYITADGLLPNTEITLETEIEGNGPSEAKVQTDGNGHFSRMIVQSFPLGLYNGLRITTTAFYSNGALIADAVETVPSKCG